MKLKVYLFNTNWLTLVWALVIWEDGYVVFFSLSTDLLLLFGPLLVRGREFYFTMLNWPRLCRTKRKKAIVNYFQPLLLATCISADSVYKTQNIKQFFFLKDFSEFQPLLSFPWSSLFSQELFYFYNDKDCLKGGNSYQDNLVTTDRWPMQNWDGRNNDKTYQFTCSSRNKLLTQFAIIHRFKEHSLTFFCKSNFSLEGRKCSSNTWDS